MLSLPSVNSVMHDRLNFIFYIPTNYKIIHLRLYKTLISIYMILHLLLLNDLNIY